MRNEDAVVILESAKFIYTHEEIKMFVEMWNDGFSVGLIGERLKTAKYNIALLVMHCDLEGMIEPRKGGMNGTIRKSYKQMGRPKKEKLVIK